MRTLLNLNNIRLRNKFLIMYVLCVMIPIIITNVSFYQVTSNNVRDQRMRDIARALEQVKNEFRMKTEDAIGISNVILRDHNLNDYLEKEYTNPTEYVAEYDSYARRMLNSYMPVYTNIQNIRIYVDNPTLIHSGAIGYLSEEVKQTDWYQAIAGISGSTAALVRTSRENQMMIADRNTRDTFSIVRRVNYIQDKNNWEKILKIEMRMPVIHQVFQNLNLTGYIYLVNQHGIIEYTTDPNVVWEEEQIRFSDLGLPNHLIKFESVYDDVQYLRGWTLIGMISEEEVFIEVRKSREYVVWMAMINLLFSTIIIVWITRSMNVRLVRILRHMKKIKNQKFETIQEAESRDEIGQLTGEFNRMTEQIKTLIDDVYKADIQRKALEIERRQAQLNALQSQINPHFLFNSLETIRMRSLIKREEETARIIQNMAIILRNSLTWSKDFVTVQEEVTLIECFLGIQKYRFGDKLNYTIAVDEAAFPYKLPKLTILPFVENASIHGIEPLKGGGTISIEIGIEDGMIISTVTDNGIGMSEEKVNKLQSFVDQEVEMGDRIGVQNVIYRLRLYYGEAFTFSVNSEPRKGTSVILKVPATGD
jgi:two-component system sensor histidine kinase YesM